MKAVVEALLGRFGFVPAHQLHFARNVAKRLDEHRELVEAISEHTSLSLNVATLLLCHFRCHFR